MQGFITGYVFILIASVLSFATAVYGIAKYDNSSYYGLAALSIITGITDMVMLISFLTWIYPIMSGR